MNPIPAIESMSAARIDYRQFFEFSPQLLCTIGADGRFVEVNPSFDAALGHAGADLVGRRFLELVHPADRPSTEAHVAFPETGPLVGSFECRFRRRDGHVPVAVVEHEARRGTTLLYCAVQRRHRVPRAGRRRR